MRVRIASAVMAPVLTVLCWLLQFASWLHQELSGLKPISKPEERASGPDFYDFRDDSSFQRLMEAAWFRAALKTIMRTEAFRMTAAVRSQVARRNFEEAVLMEGAITVFEDIEAVFNGYAKLYDPTAKKPRQES